MAWRRATSIATATPTWPSLPIAPQPLCNGTGSFGAAANYAAGINPDAVAAGDFNRDDKLDLATANYGADNVSVLLGTGTGSFGAATNFAATSGPISVALDDFN